MQNLALPSLVLGPLTLALSAAAARADVVFVPPPSAPDDPALFDAIAAAAPGDTLVLAEGIYGPPEPADQLVLDKPLRLIGAGSHLTRIEFNSFAPLILFQPQIDISGIGTAESLELAGLELVVGSNSDVYGALDINDCAGTVALLDVRLSPNLVNAGPGLRAENCAALTLQDFRCEQARLQFVDSTAQLTSVVLTGFDQPAGSPLGGNGQPAIVAERSGLYLTDATVNGGDAGSFGVPVFGDFNGNPGLRLATSAVTVTGGSVLSGGTAGTLTQSGGRGGPAIAADPFSRVRVDASNTLLGGQGKFGPAPSIVAQAGASVQTEDRAAVAMTVSQTVWDPSLELRVDLSGEPGALVVVYQVLGFAGSPLVTPVPLVGVDGLVGLDLALAFPLFAGAPIVLDSSGGGEVITAITGSGLATLETAYQAAELLPNGGTRVSNAVLSVARE